MKFLKKTGNFICSKGGAYVSFVLAAFAFVFLKSSTWAYGFIAQLYPLGENFVPTVLVVTIILAAISLAFLIMLAIKSDKESKLYRVTRWIQLAALILSVVAFVFTLVLVFRLDSGINAQNIASGVEEMAQYLIYLFPAIALPLAFVFCQGFKKTISAAVSMLVIVGIMLSLVSLKKPVTVSDSKIPEMKFMSENIMKDAEITFESLKSGENPDAANMLKDDNSCWTAQYIAFSPAEGQSGTNNSVAEIQLAKEYTFNTAVIDESGNQAQYFRLQAFINDEWVTVYEGEKIQAMHICSFDAVTTDRIRLSVDKFRDYENPVKIKSLKLYNEPKRTAENFEATVYQRLDGDVPTEVLAKGEEFVKNYARYYDVYTTVLVFAAVHWDENGEMNFGEGGEEWFAEQLNALREIISYRSNKNHEVKIIVTALADGTWGEFGVNDYMARNWESIADKIIAFADKYQLDGVDIDWEYPDSQEDWENFNKFITRLDDGLKAKNPNSILSAALSSWGLGMSKEVLNRFDQIQFMAYDGKDVDGYQSSLRQAQEGLQAFVDNGADISKINIGIAAYARPVTLTGYWGIWRTLEEATYWNSRYYNIHDGSQVYEGTFCSPAVAGDKTAYALFSGAGGVMVFRLGCDKTMDDPNAVACGIENALNRYVENW